MSQLDSRECEPCDGTGIPEPGVSGKKKRESHLNHQHETDSFYQKARDEVDTLCHHDPHLMKIVESIRGILREQDQKRDFDCEYTPPKRPGLMYGDRHANFHNLTSRKAND